MKVEIIKGICEVVVLVILYIIQWRQDERITVLENKKKKGGVKPYQPKVYSFTGLEPLKVSNERFSSKLASEEKRMNETAKVARKFAKETVKKQKIIIKKSKSTK